MFTAPTMHCSSFTHQQGPLLRPVTRTTPFRPVSATKGKSHRTLHRRLVSANALEDLAQDLVQVVQASPLVSGAVATTGDTRWFRSACILKRADQQSLAAVVGGIVALLWTASQASGMAEGSQPGPNTQASQAASSPRTDAVLVFGATGRLGTELVSQV